MRKFCSTTFSPARSVGTKFHRCAVVRKYTPMGCSNSLPPGHASRCNLAKCTAASKGSGVFFAGESHSVWKDSIPRKRLPTPSMSPQPFDRGTKLASLRRSLRNESAPGASAFPLTFCQARERPTRRVGRRSIALFCLAFNSRRSKLHRRESP